MFISEDYIDKAAELISASEKALAQAIEEMQEDQPILLAYCFSENFDVFTNQEKEYMLYLVLVIWKSVELAGADFKEITEEEISKGEEANWTLFTEQKAKTFRDKLTPFFEDYPQEDLLAFIEDSLELDEESEEEMITAEGRAALFISLKTIVDIGVV
jgi:hypothetical protein